MPLGKVVGLCPGHIVLHGDPVGTQRQAPLPPPHFRPMPIVAKRSPISATAELLFLFATGFIIPVYKDYQGSLKFSNKIVINTIM